MDNWRIKGNQEFGRSKSDYHKRKPPAAGGNSNGQHNISSWEKRFVTSSISWQQFLEAKKYIHLHIYDKISNWDDSAGKEAFKTAKDAFYAKLHGIPYDVKSYNPDLYNNKIDWNSQEDNDLIRDFESEVVVQVIDNNHEPVVIFGDALPDPYKNYVPGWGDADDNVKGSWGVGDDNVKGSWGVGDDMNKGDGNVIEWDDYIKDGKIISADIDAGCKNNNWWDWTDNKAGNQGWNDTADNAGDEGWNYNDNKAGYQGWNETRNKAVYQGWNYKGWNETDNQAGNQGGNGTDNKAGYQGWNNYVDDYNSSYYPSYGNNNNNHYPSYGNVNNERYDSCNFTGNNSQRSRTWRNNGIRSKSSGQGYGRQRAHGSTMQARGDKRIHVNQ